ncbi:MAG: polysaccharide biosynthesis protein [Clostridia bacterium]|nr:polysaccharide biosynthesis protein [Clostridia bacterium]
MASLFNNGKVRRVILFIMDILMFVGINEGYYQATRIFSNSPNYNDKKYLVSSLVLLASIVFFRLVFRVYSNIWRYTSTKAYFNLILADLCGGALAIVISRAFPDTSPIYLGIWHSLNVASLTALFSVLARLTYRLIYKSRKGLDPDGSPHINVAIVGAGQLGAILASDLTTSHRTIYNPVFFIDTDNAKTGSRVHNLPVYKENAAVLEKIKRYSVSEIFIAIANLTSEEATRIYNFYSLTGCKIKLYDLPVRDANPNAVPGKRTIREFQIEDLLFRQPINFFDSESKNYYSDKTILVTGGGGSIGSEICRQLAKCSPKKLIIVDIYENNAYDIQQELVRKYGDKLNLAVEIASVRDKERLSCLFKNYRPNIVFHAAAHKHVPLMEQSGCEAIKNNVLGTYNTADVAEEYGVEKFILISTDKAVNPTNIMGASKRLCEMVVQCRTDSKTSFAAVRFGNVLGSNGSVIPLFKRQIAAGGPITITDKRIIRYFMTIPEASQLVMQAGAMANKGELFVLDMGKPVRIYDLAVNMIKLSGFEPDVDIKIEEIGLRPGEKLYEELLMKTETLDMTENKMIFIERDTPLTREQVDEKLAVLKQAVEESKCEIGSAKVKEAVKSVVPTFREPNEINKDAASSNEMKEAKVN